MQDAIIVPLIYVLAFVAVMLLVQALGGILFWSRDRTRSVNRRLDMLESGMDQKDVYETLVRKPISPKMANQFANDLIERFARVYHQSGMAMPMGRFVLTVGASAFLLWMVALSALRSAGQDIGINLFVSLIASCTFVGVIAWLLVTRRRNARLKLLEEQIPLALDVVNRALRAGHPVVSAVQLAAAEMGDPIGSEFGLIVDETTYGFQFKDALTNFARRTGSRDAHFFAVSVGIQSETGGNLAEILAGLASVVRSRMTLLKRVRALSSEGRTSALILSVLPLLMISFMALTKPNFYTSKFADPIFWPVVGGVCVVYFIGWYMIHKIINFKY